MSGAAEGPAAEAGARRYVDRRREGLARNGPFKGLVPFRESDHRLLFGRYRERRIIRHNLAVNHLTVVYGPSGVGKSSLLRAGVVHDMRSAGTEPAPILVCFNDWRPDPLPRIVTTAAREAGLTELPAVSADLEGPALWLARLEAITRATGRPLYLVLDQFEDFLWMLARRGPDDGPEPLDVVLPPLTNDRALPVRVLFSLQEDALAGLDAFRDRIDGLLENAIRVDHLDRIGAREAIERPLAVYAELVEDAEGPTAIEEGLVHRLLAELPRGGAAQAEAVAQAVPDAQIERPAAAHHIPAVYLQIVMNRLWHEGREGRRSSLTTADLDKLGGVEQIIERHVESALQGLSRRQKGTAATLLAPLSDPTRGRPFLSRKTLAEATDLPEERVSAVLGQLTAADRRLLQGIRDGYQVPHRAMASRIWAWTRIYRERRRRRRVGQGAFMAAAGLVSLVGAAFQVNGQLRAGEQENRALAARQRLETHARQLHLAGFVEERSPVVARTTTAGESVDTVELEAGEAYATLGTCSDECELVQEISSLQEPDDPLTGGELVRFTAARSGPHRITTVVRGCPGGACTVARAQYRRTPEGTVEMGLLFHGERIASTMAAERAGEPVLGRLGAGDDYAFTIPSPPPDSEYVVLAVCEQERCSDLDLSVRSAGVDLSARREGPLVSQDVASDALPFVTIPPSPDGAAYRVEVSMIDCEAMVECFYGYQLYRARRGATWARLARGQLDRHLPRDPDGVLFTGTLPAGADTALTLTWEGGTSAVVLGVCDVSCADVDLALRRGDTRIAHDTLPDDTPLVELPPEGRDYQLDVSMWSCDVERCGWAVRVAEIGRVVEGGRRPVEDYLGDDSLDDGTPLVRVTFGEGAPGRPDTVSLEDPPPQAGGGEIRVAVVRCGYLCSSDPIGVEVLEDDGSPAPDQLSLGEMGFPGVIYRPHPGARRLRLEPPCHVSRCLVGARVYRLDPDSEMGRIARELLGDSSPGG